MGLPIGSSAKIIFGLLARERAMTTRFLLKHYELRVLLRDASASPATARAERTIIIGFLESFIFTPTPMHRCGGLFTKQS